MYSTGICEMYNNGGTIAMETFLYHSEYSMFNEDANGVCQIDRFLYFQVFECQYA